MIFISHILHLDSETIEFSYLVGFGGVAVDPFLRNVLSMCFQQLEGWKLVMQFKICLSTNYFSLNKISSGWIGETMVKPLTLHIMANLSYINFKV